MTFLPRKGGQKRLATVRKRQEHAVNVVAGLFDGNACFAETHDPESSPLDDEHDPEVQEYLKPLSAKDLKSVGVFTFDIESKDGDTQVMGLTRPFAVGFFDGQNYVSFINDADLKERVPVWSERHLARGGCIDKFLRWLFAEGKTKKEIARYQSKRGAIFGHNAGKFDMLFVLGWLLRNRNKYEFSIAAVQSRIQRLDIWLKGTSKKKCWTFLDSVSLLPMTLEKVGETFAKTQAANAEQATGEKVTKQAIDLNLHEDDPNWVTYLRADCTTLYYGLHAYQGMMHKLGGEIGITAPASAMKLYRRAFQKDWLYIGAHFPECKGKCERNEIDDDGFILGCPREELCDGGCHGCLHEFIRLGYYGGRTELFASYGRNILYFDINSSYPASMRETMPVGKPYVVLGGTWRDMARRRKKGIGFIECEVEIPKGCKLPPLPYRVPEGRRVVIVQPDGTETVVPPGKLIFPTGKLRGVWDFDELSLLVHPLVKGKVTKIHRSVWYAEKAIFVEFVDKLYSYRNKDDPKNYSRGVIERDAKGRITNDEEFNSALAETCKLMLNSLYGKFGMREERTSLQLVANPEQGPSVWPTGGWPIDGDHDKCIVWEVEHIVNAPYIIPQISAHITALSRMRLFRGMADVILQGGKVYYCDTDSIMTDTPIHESKQLGGWKIENPPDALLSGRFVLPKMYQLGHHQLDCPWILYGIGEPCDGCHKSLHTPECKRKKGKDANGNKCKGCTTTKQVMKGVGGDAKTAGNWDKMLLGLDVTFERLSGFRGMLNTATTAEKIDDVNQRKEERIVTRIHKTLTRKGVELTKKQEKLQKIVGPLLSPIVIEAKKSIRSRYDKRVLQRNGTTIPVHIQ